MHAGNRMVLAAVLMAGAGSVGMAHAQQNFFDKIKLWHVERSLGGRTESLAHYQEALAGLVRLQRDLNRAVASTNDDHALSSQIVASRVGVMWRSGTRIVGGGWWLMDDLMVRRIRDDLARGAYGYYAQVDVHGDA